MRVEPQARQGTPGCWIAFWVLFVIGCFIVWVPLGLVVLLVFLIVAVVKLAFR